MGQPSVVAIQNKYGLIAFLQGHGVDEYQLVVNKCMPRTCLMKPREIHKLLCCS